VKKEKLCYTLSTEHTPEQGEIYHLHTKEGEPFEMRLATREDIPELIETERSAVGLKTYSPMLTEEEWKEAFIAGDVFLMIYNGKVVGNFSYEQKAPDRIYLSGLVVSPELRGKGIGSAVLSWFLARHEDVPYIDLYTHPENLARKLYESFGFVFKEKIENCYGDGEPRVLLVRTKEVK
jgi:ribosomal protein S18 acetylase RimI-like enzyme